MPLWPVFDRSPAGLQETAGFEVDVKRGDILGITPDYLEKKVSVFLEIGIKLAQVIARKVDWEDESIKLQENVLNTISYELISHEHYELASRLLDFACEIMKKHPKWGVELLEETDLIPKESYFPVLQHHERGDRRGYPGYF